LYEVIIQNYTVRQNSALKHAFINHHRCQHGR